MSPTPTRPAPKGQVAGDSHAKSIVFITKQQRLTQHFGVGRASWQTQGQEGGGEAPEFLQTRWLLAFPGTSPGQPSGAGGKGRPREGCGHRSQMAGLLGDRAQGSWSLQPSV